MRNCGNETVTNWWPFIYDLLIPHTLHNHDSLVIFFVWQPGKSGNPNAAFIKLIAAWGSPKNSVFFSLLAKKFS